MEYYKSEKLLDPAKVRELFSYEDGRLIWRSGQRAGMLAGTLTHDGYLEVRIRRKSYLAHRLVWAYVTRKWPCGTLDHVDCDPANNRFENLRIATASQNLANRRRRVSRKHDLPKGVAPRGSVYRAEIYHNKKRTRLGTFKTIEAAAAAYREAAVAIYGEFARVS